MSLSRATTIAIAAAALAAAGPVSGPAASPLPRQEPRAQSGGAQSSGAVPDPLVFCAEAENPPMSQIGVPAGFDVEVAEALGSELGVRVRIAWLRPHADVAELALLDGRCAAATGATVTEGATMAGRTPDGVALTRPYYAAAYVLVRAAGAPPVRTLDALDGRIAVESVSAAAYTLRQRGYSVHVLPDAAAVIEAVAAGRQKAGYLWGPLAAWLLRDRRDVVVDGAFEPIERWSFALAVPSTAGTLRSVLSGAIEAAAGDGTLAAIFARYGIPQKGVM
ncbi:MAG: transporter substrate-binding domain-containing protein [Gemmatimonadetes bacterium]|nr:transporter substrate-binding domain-containing protein [Gemmatimonadota bacterium]